MSTVSFLLQYNLNSLKITKTHFPFISLHIGFIVMSLVKKKSGREAIPNYSFWIEVPGLIKEGATFSTSCVTGKFSSSHQTMPEGDQEGSDAFGGGGGSSGGGSSSSGKTAYDAI